METYFLSPRILDESFLWFLDVKPIRAFVLHMTKTSLGHYQMVYNSIQITTDRKLQQICKITQTLVCLAHTSINFC